MAIDLGKIAMTLKGAYNPGTVYMKLDVVTYNGSSYVSLIENNNNPIEDVSKWQIVALKGSDGSIILEYNDIFDI